MCHVSFSFKDGLVKQIGVSNYNERHLGELLDYAQIRPMASQFEIHPFNTREKLVQMCQASDSKKTKTWHKALSFVLKIGITIHKISTFWPKKNPVECFSLALRIWASESMATHRWAEKEIRTRHGLRRIDWFRFSQNSQRCEFWCLPNAMLLYVAICCYTMWSPPVVSWYMKL